MKTKEAFYVTPVRVYGMRVQGNKDVGSDEHTREYREKCIRPTRLHTPFSDMSDTNLLHDVKLYSHLTS